MKNKLFFIAIALLSVLSFSSLAQPVIYNDNVPDYALQTNNTKDKIQISNHKAAPIKVMISNERGQTVYTSDVNRYKAIDLGNFNTGKYSIVIKTGEQSQVMKLEIL